MILSIAPDGGLRFIYNDDIDHRALGAELGPAQIRRASHVEPTEDGQWTADMGPVGGGVLGPFPGRQAALDAEVSWLREHVL